MTDEENERHWAGRAGKRQLVAFAQLAAVPDDPPRPDFWTGYRVVPQRFEFWIEDDDDVHDRFEYARDGGVWSRRRLQP